MSRIRPLWATIVAAGLTACGTKDVVDPFPVPVDRFFDLSPTIVITPAQVATDEIDVPDSVLAAIETELRELLHGAGHAVVDVASYLEIWEPIVDQVGGFYDPITGHLDSTKADAARADLLEKLDARFGPHALLFPEIHTVEAAYSSGRAAWDGTSQRVASWFDIVADAIAGTVLALSGEYEGSSLPNGTVVASSLLVAIEDSSGAEIFANWGGIEVVSKTNGSWIDADHRFLDPTRYRQAVRVALEPILEARRHLTLQRNQ